MSILTSIPVQNGLLLAIVPSMRSFLDWSGNSHTVTPTATVWARRNGVFGLEYPVGANLTIPHHADFESADKSIFIGGKLDKHHYYDTLIIKQVAGNYTFYAYLTVAGVSIYNGPVEADWTFSKAGMRSCCITHQAAQKATLYKNGASMGLSHLAIDWQGSTGNIEVSNSDVLYPLRQPNYTRSFLWYNRVLPADEVSETARWSDSLSSPSLPADRRHFDMGSRVPIGNAGGVVGAWDLGIVTNREVADRSGGGLHGAVNGIASPVQTIVGRALRGHGSGDEGVSIPSITAADDFSFETLVLARSEGPASSGRLFQIAGGHLAYFFGTPVANIGLYLAGVTGSPWTVNGVVTQDQWLHLVITRRRSDGALAMYVNGSVVYSTTAGTEALNWSGLAYLMNNAGAGAGIRAFDGDMGFAQFIQRYMEADEVKRRYAPIARKVMYELGDYLLPTLTNVTVGQTIPGTDLRVITGTFAVPEDADGPYLSCVGAGKLREQLPGAANFATDLFTATGTAALSKNAGDIEIDCGNGDTVRAVRLTLGAP